MNIVQLMTKTTVYASIKEDFGITNTVLYANILRWKAINPFRKGQHKSFNGT